MTEKILIPIELEIRAYRNEKLNKFIGDNFDEAGQAIAWKAVKFIRETWPETEIPLRGELMSIDKQGA